MAVAVQRDPRIRVAEFQEWVAGMPDAERWDARRDTGSHGAAGRAASGDRRQPRATPRIAIPEREGGLATDDIYAGLSFDTA